jgi:hypothetical protein
MALTLTREGRGYPVWTNYCDTCGAYVESLQGGPEPPTEPTPEQYPKMFDHCDECNRDRRIVEAVRLVVREELNRHWRP